MAQAMLLLIPREIRDRIYHFTFAGSCLHRCSAQSRWHVKGHVAILLTLYGPVPRPKLNRKDILTIFGLSQHLNNFAKSRLRHIRHVSPSRGSNAFLNKLGLDQFPRLETCEVIGMPVMHVGSHSYMVDGDEQSLFKLIASMKFKSRDPHRTLEEWEIDPKQYNVEFLTRFTIIVSDPFNGSRAAPKRTWINMTTKKFFIKLHPQRKTISEDEKGFRHVLTKRPSRFTELGGSSSHIAPIANGTRAEDDENGTVGQF
ncbi:hypothetical protein F4803DRAFT_571566 [Xylaria telfairii]|nr:hypothetical protein F4803DRAFT_571566 [Xylaria telfairii]